MSNDFQHRRESLIALVRDRWNGVYVHTGKHREVYDIPHKNVVVKIPVNEGTARINIAERDAFRRAIGSGDKRYARCRLIRPFGIPVVIMERIECLYMPNGAFPSRGFPDPEPEWIKLIDAEQVGYTSTGELVAFDYSDDELKHFTRS